MNERTPEQRLAEKRATIARLCLELAKAVAPSGSPFAKGTRVAHLYAATRNDHAYGVNARWTSDKVLRIEFMGARLADIDPPGSFNVNGQVFSVELQDGVIDPTACAGGMLYSANRRDCGGPSPRRSPAVSDRHRPNGRPW